MKDWRLRPTAPLLDRLGEDEGVKMMRETARAIGLVDLLKDIRPPSGTDDALRLSMALVLLGVEPRERTQHRTSSIAERAADIAWRTMG